MASSRRFLAVALACVFLVSGCGDSKKPGTTAAASGGGGGTAAAPAPVPTQPPPPAAMLSLSPEGTVGVVYIADVKKLEGGVKRLAATAGEQEGPPELAQLAQMMGMDVADLDLGKPAAVTLTMKAGQPPKTGMTMILPVKDEKGIAAKLKEGNPGVTVETAGGFAAVTPEGSYKKAGPPPSMNAALPAGDIVIRLDVATLWKAYGPMGTQMVESQLAAMNDMPGAAASSQAVKPMLDAVKAALDAASVLDLAFRIDGTNVELDATLRFADGAKMPLEGWFGKTDLAALARAVPDDSMMVMAASFDQQRMWSAMKPMMMASLDAYPAAERDKLRKTFDSIGDSMKSLGQGMAMSMDFSPQGMTGVGAIDSKDPGAYVKTMMQATSELEAQGGMMSRTPPQERTLEGVKVTTYTMKVDASKMEGGKDPEITAQAQRTMTSMMGKDGLRVNVADLGNKALISFGGDDALVRAIKAAKSGSAQTPLSTALMAAGSDTIGYARFDVGAIMATMGRVMSPDPAKAPASPGSAPMTFILNSGTKDVRVRISFDLDKMMKAVKSAMPK